VKRGSACDDIVCTVTVALKGSESEQRVPTRMPQSIARSNASEPTRRERSTGFLCKPCWEGRAPLKASVESPPFRLRHRLSN
jgi:hypothetical protein